MQDTLPDARVERCADEVAASPQQVASYAKAHLQELRDLAQRADLSFLRYAIDIALVEANDVARGKPATELRADADPTDRFPSADQIAELLRRF